MQVVVLYRNFKRSIESEIANYLIHEAAVMVRVVCRSYKK